jgi:hypothetical protein
MVHRSQDPSGTQEVPLRRLSFRKVGELGRKVKGGGSLGWEYEAPEVGRPYKVYLEDGALFRTSTVREIERTEMGAVLRTENSLYEVRYLGREDRNKDPVK